MKRYSMVLKIDCGHDKIFNGSKNRFMTRYSMVLKIDL